MPDVQEGPVVTISTGTSTENSSGDVRVIACEMCGTRLRPNREPDGYEDRVNSLVSVARHRCVPRVTVRADVSEPR
jgi:hypothetical protein